MFSKFFEKFANDRPVDHLEKCGIFSGCQGGFMYSLSTADLLIIESDRIEGAFNRSWATQTVALDISKTFNRVSDVGLLYKLNSYEISGHVLGLNLFFSVINRSEWFWTGESLQEYLVIAGVSSKRHSSIYISDLPDNVICKIAVYADVTTLCSKCDDVCLVATARIHLWTWIWPMRCCRNKQEVACWFQHWKTQLV